MEEIMLGLNVCLLNRLFRMLSKSKPCFEGRNEYDDVEVIVDGDM